MPSWITHFVTANKIKKDKEQNEFIFANIMPDILEGYNIKTVSKIVKDYQTHYPEKKEINGITIPIPDIQSFEKKYKDKMRNPVIKGYYCHLLTDYYWNTYTYENYFENFDKKRNLVKIKLNTGEQRIVKWDEAVKIKQKDFHSFTGILKENEKIVKPHYSEMIKKYSEELEEFQFTSKDIKNTIEFIQKMLQEPNNSKEQYQIFTRIELLKKLEESIIFIKSKLKFI